MNLFGILVGAALLIFGRGLFWLFVGAAGFAAGTGVADHLFSGQPEWVAFGLAILFGVVAALLAIFLQKLAIVIGGFLSGGYLAMALCTHQGNPSWTWAALAIGGVLGALLILFLFDWALILLSSLTGAALISGSLQLDSTLTTVVFLALIVFGVGVQGSQLGRSRRAKREAAESKS